MAIQTATNPKTGERIALINGQWVPFTQSATNDSGQKAFLVGGNWVTEPGAAPAKQPKEEGFFSNVGNLLVEGGKSALSAAEISPSVISGGVDKDQAATIAKELGRERVQPKALQEAQAAFADEAAAYKKAKGLEAIIPVGQMIAEFGKQAVTNPEGAIYLMASSAANMAPSIAGMLAGAKLGGMAGTAVAPGLGTAVGTVTGGIAGGFTGQAPLEIGMEFTGRVGEELQRRGLEPTEANVAKLLEDPRFVTQAVGEARTKGSTTAAVDAAFTLGAGRFASAPGRSALKAAAGELGDAATPLQIATRADELLKARTLTQKVGRGAGAVGIDVAGGGLSEAAGQLAAYGEVDLADVGLEMLGELGGSAIEVPAAVRALREPKPEAAPPEVPVQPDGVETLPEEPDVEDIPPERKVETLPPAGFTDKDIIDTGVQIPGGNLPFVRRNVLGKTRDELQAFVEENPELIENESPSSRVIRSLLSRPARQPDQLGVEPSVPPVGRAGIPDTGAAVPPQRAGLDVAGPVAGPAAAPAPAPTPAVTETPSGITTPEAIEAEAQGPQAPRVPVPTKQVDRFGELRPGPLDEDQKLPELSDEEMMELGIPTEARQPKAPKVPKEPTIRPIENPANIGGDADSTWKPGETPSAIPVADGGTPFRSRREAEAARRLQPAMRLLKVPNGFLLTPKTDAQMDAQARAGRKLGMARGAEKGTPRSAVEFIAEKGGLDPRFKNETVFSDRNPRVGNRFLFAAQGKGMSLSQVSEALQQEGYIDVDDINEAINAINNLTYTDEGNTRLAEMREAQREEEYKKLELLEEATAEWVEELGYDVSDLEDAGFFETTDKVKAEVAEMLKRAEALGIHEDDVFQKAIDDAYTNAQLQGRNQPTQYEIYITARKELQSVFERGPEDRVEDSGQPSETRDELTLAPPTREAQAEAERRAAQAPAEQERDQIKRESEAGADQFRLEGGEGRQDITGRLFQQEGRRVRFTHRTDTEPGKGQASGFYPGTYAYEEGADTGPIPSRGGAKAFVGELNESDIYTLKDAEALKREAAQAGFEYRQASGNSEVEYLKSQGFKAMRRGPEIIVFDAKDAGFQQEGIGDTIQVGGKKRPTKNSSGRPIETTREKLQNFWRWFGDSKVTGADGKPMVVYHSTYSDVDKFKTNFADDEYRRFGAHVGSLEAAENRLDIKAAEDAANRERSGAAGANIMPVYVRIKNPLRLDENRSGRWGVDDIMRSIMEKADSGEIDEISVDDVDDYMSDTFDIESWLGITESPGDFNYDPNRPVRMWSDTNEFSPGERSDLLKAFIQQLGYDGIVYANEFEGGGDSYIAINSNQIKSATGNTGAYSNEMSSILEERTDKGGWKIEPEEQRVEREIAGLDVDGLTQYAIDNAPNEYAREVAQKIQARIRAMAKSGVEMSFTLYTGDRRPILMSNARGMVDYTIFKDKPIQMSLKLNGAAAMENQNGYPPGARYETILHELLHMATATQITMGKDTQLVEDLNNLRNQIVEHFNNKVKTGKLTAFEQQVYNRTINALSKPDEILAWGITDKEMQEFLAGIKVGERSLFDRFVDIIQRVLGLDRPYRSALEDVLRTTDALLDIGVDQIAADTQKRGFMFGPSNPRLEDGQIQGALFQEETPIAKPDAVQGEGKAAVNNSRQSIIYKPVNGTWSIDPDLKEFGLSDEFFYDWVDKQRDLKRVVDAINATAKRVDSKFNAIEKERTFHGRVAERTRLYGEQELKPVIEMMSKFGLSQRDVGEYLLMRHVPEANRVIAERNPKYVKKPGTGYETSAALQYMRDLDPKKKKNLEAVAKRMDETLTKMQNMLVEYKIEDDSTIQGWRDMFQHYIPLVREDGDFSVNKVMSQGAGYSTAGATSKSRTGSEKPINVDEIFTNIAMQHERMIVRAEKGRVAQSLFGLALTQPNPNFWLAIDPETNVIWKTIKDLAQLKDDRDLIKEMLESGSLSPSQEVGYRLELDLINKMIKKKEKPSRDAFARVRDDLIEGFNINSDEATALVKEIMMPPMKARYVKDKNTVVYEPAAAFSNEFVFTARINGSDKYVLFNGKDPRAARMAGALKNVDGESLNRAMNVTAMITRYFAAINTQYNPVFGAYNFLRDIQTAALQISTTDIADKSKEVRSGTMPALKTIFKILRAERAGKPAKGDDVTEYNRYRLAGGQTGYRDQFSQTAERAAAIQRLIDPSSWSESPLGKVFSANGKLKVPMETARKAAAPLFDLLSDYNQTLENSVRFSAFKVAKQKYLDQGMTLDDAEQKAAVISKEITVNFNQKGAKINTIGALYAFFNASVQGTYMMAKTYAGPLGKTIIRGSLLWGSIQAILLAMAGFDDDEPPEFVKQRNFIIPYGLIIPGAEGKYLAFPMPLGFNVLPTLSRLATEAVLTGGEKTPEKVLAALDAALDMFNPIGNAGLSGQTIAPTLLDPIIALIENKNWTGQDIAREDFSDLNPTPGFTRSRDASTAVAKGFAEFLNTVSGGNESRKGLISPTADQLEYLAGQLTGGVGRETVKLFKTAEATATGEELPFYSVPLIGRFHGNVNEMASISNAFYRNLTELNIQKNEIKNLRENKGDVQAYLAENPEARLAQMATTQYNQIKNLRKLRQEALEKGNKERAKTLEEAIKKRMINLNERFKKAAG